MWRREEIGEGGSIEVRSEPFVGGKRQGIEGEGALWLNLQGRLSPDAQVHIGYTSPPSFPTWVILNQDPNNTPSTNPLEYKESTYTGYNLHSQRRIKSPTTRITEPGHEPDKPSVQQHLVLIPIFIFSVSKFPEIKVQMQNHHTTTPEHHATPQQRSPKSNHSLILQSSYHQ